MPSPGATNPLAPEIELGAKAFGLLNDLIVSSERLQEEAQELDGLFGELFEKAYGEKAHTKATNLYLVRADAKEGADDA